MGSTARNKLTERTWNSSETCVWNNLSGQRVELGEVDLLSLSESECVALQKIAEQRLRDIDVGVSITVPKDESKALHGKHNNSVLKRLQGGKSKSKKDQDHVFSIPLVRVVENDQLLRLQTVDDGPFSSFGTGANDDDSTAHSSSEASPKSTRRKSSSQDLSSAEHSTSSVVSTTPTVESNDQVFHRTSSPSTPPNESPASRRKGARALRRRGAVGLDTDTEIDPDKKEVLESLVSSTRDKKRELLPPTMPQVPYVVQKCCAHIIKHGLDVTGIFRIAGSKKRVKQLREEFDHGVDVKIDEDYHAHDVAALLKEFFRDLPEALLTRELYQAFISTAKLSAPQRLSALRCLVWLLPIPNRDTLQQLLSFLANVAEHSEGRLDSCGKAVCGNKMGVSNLSVIFGPNILHRNKKTGQSSNDAQFQVQSMERAEESTFVIKIVDEMIRSQKELFMIPRETHHEILRSLQESDPDAVDFLLRRKAANYTKSPTSKSPTERPDENELNSEEVEKSAAVPNDDFAAKHSDMNNNKNNSKSQDDVCEKEIVGAQATHSRQNGNDNNAKAVFETSLSGQSPARKKEGSISFTDEDMNDILRIQNVSPTRTNNERPLSDCNGLKSSKERPHTVSHNRTTKMKSTDASAKKPPAHHNPQSLHIHYYRRQGFSLNPNAENLPKKEHPKPNHTRRNAHGKGNGKTVGNIYHTPKEEKTVSTTSGFVDMSSSSDSLGTYGQSSERLAKNIDPWVPKNHAGDSKHRRHREALSQVHDPATTDMRKRLPSGLNVRVNRTHGKDSTVALHSLRIPTTSASSRSTESPPVQEINTAGAGRRVSKDDMHLTLRGFRRRQWDIMI